MYILFIFLFLFVIERMDLISLFYIFKCSKWNIQHNKFKRKKLLFTKFIAYEKEEGWKNIFHVWRFQNCLWSTDIFTDVPKWYKLECATFLFSKFSEIMKKKCIRKVVEGDFCTGRETYEDFHARLVTLSETLKRYW